MPPGGRLIYGEHGCGKTTALAQVAASLLASGVRPTEILALSVHSHGARRLRAALRDALGVDIPTADVRRRATAVLEQFPVAAGLPDGWQSSDILSAVDRHVLMRTAWSRAANAPEALYARYGSAPGALDWLQGLFDAFAEWSGTADPERLERYVPADPALAELWSAYRGYLQLGRQHGVVAFQEVLGRALDALDVPDVRARVAPRILLLDDVDLFRPSDLLFARALATPETQIVATSSALADGRSPDGRLRYVARWCAEVNLTPAEKADAPTAPPRERVQLEFPTLEAEVEAIAQYIATTMAPGGRFADYAVIAFDPALPPLLRRALPRWGIAVEGMEARDAFSLALAPVLHAALRLLAGLPLPAEEFAAFLSHPLLDLPGADAHLLTIAIAGTAGGARSPGGYDFGSFPERRWPGDLSAEGRWRLRRIAVSLDELGAADLAPSAKLRRWLAALDLPARGRRQAATVLDAWAMSADQELLDRWLAFLERTEQLHAALGSPLGDLEAVDVLLRSQALVDPISRPLADAVQVWQPDQLGGCTASTVWLAGVHEDALPPKTAPLPWVTPDALTAALAALPGWIPPEQDDRVVRWTEALATLRRAAGHARQTAILSWSAAGRDGRRRLLSPVLAGLPDVAAITQSPSPAAWSGDQWLPQPRQALTGPSLQPVSAGIEFAPPPAETVFSTSPSAIENFLRCPRQYFYARVLKLYDIASTPRQALGQVVHAALRDLKSKEDGADIAALIDEHWPANDRRWGTPLREAAFRRVAEQAVERVETFDRAHLPGDVRFVLAEASFTWQIAPDAELRGTIDRIDHDPDGLTILDYKLGAHSPTIRELLDTFAPPPAGDELAAWRPADLQLPLYALAVERGSVEGLAPEAGSRVAAVGLVYPRELFTARGKPSEKGRRMIRLVDHAADCAACGSERTPARGVLCRDELQRIADRALVAIAGMRAGNIAPDPRDGSDTCGACPFRTICPAPRA